MKTSFSSICTLVLLGGARAYNSPLRKLGNTPQPSFAGVFNKPEKSGIPPWMPLRPQGIPFGVPEPHRMPMGIPIAPDPSPNDYSYGPGPVDMGPGFGMHEQMHREDPAVFSNEDSWAWRAERQMPHLDMDSNAGPGTNNMGPFDFPPGMGPFDYPVESWGNVHPGQDPRFFDQDPRFFDQPPTSTSNGVLNGQQGGIPDWRREQHFRNDPTTQNNQGLNIGAATGSFADNHMEIREAKVTNDHNGQERPAQPWRNQNQNANNGAQGPRRRLVRYRPNRNNREGPPSTQQRNQYHQAPPAYQPMQDPNQQMGMGMNMDMNKNMPPPHHHPQYPQDPRMNMNMNMDMNEQTYFNEPQFFRPPPGMAPNFDYDWFYNGHSSYTQQHEGDNDGFLYY